MIVGDLAVGEYVQARNLFIEIDDRIFQIYTVGYGGKSWRTVYVMKWMRDGTLMIDDYSMPFTIDVLYPVEEPCLPLKT